MYSRVQQYLQKDTIRHHARVMAYGVCGVFSGAALMALYLYLPADSAVIQRYTDATATSTEIEVPYTLPAAEPVKLRIPKLNLEASFEEPLGINEYQEIEVPIDFSKVGWYKYGPTPGELGPAVVLGHVDSKAGPAVFYSLKQLTEGDRIEITREDGSVAVFAVEQLEQHVQKEFPTALVYGDIPYAGIRLVTCSGWFDRTIKRYSHNLIVFARLVEDEKPQ